MACRRCRKADVAAFLWFRRGGLALSLAVAAVLLFGAPAIAADPPEPDAERKAEASAHLKRGAELIDAENLEGALVEFEAAYRLVPSPNILHNFGVVYQGLGRKAAALEAFERFLAAATRAPPATREHAQRAAQALRAEVAELRVQSDIAGAAIFVDGKTVGQTPQEKPIYLDPGPHHVSVEKPGGGTGHAERIQASAGQQVTVAMRPPVAPPTAAVEAVQPAPPAQTGDWQRPAAWTAAAAATVAAGAFGAAMLVRYQRLTEFNDLGCGTKELHNYPRECAPLLDRGRKAEKWAKATGAAAGVLAVGSALLFLTLPDAPLEVSVQASPGNLGFGLQGRF
jgi:tetratricopeptide (TPR) repeat protein